MYEVKIMYNEAAKNKRKMQTLQDLKIMERHTQKEITKFIVQEETMRHFSWSLCDLTEKEDENRKNDMAHQLVVVMLCS